MFPIEYQVNVRRGEGPVRTYALLENQNDKHLVVIHPAALAEMTAYTKKGNPHDDGLIALLVDEAVVIDRKKGTPLPMAEACKVMAKSKHPAIRRAATFRQPLPDWSLNVTGEDLAWAFSLEAAKRRLSA